jgi:4-amino-4-deoxy-L-arabinose transferase-like glycosyltransferase
MPNLSHGRFDRWTRWQHLVALAAGLVTVAGIYAAPHPRVVWPDSTEYLELARNLAAGRGFSYDDAPATRGRMPGYPALLAWSGYLAHNPPGHERAPLVQALFVALTVLAAGWIATLIGGSRTGPIAAVMCALYLPLYANAVAVLTECMTTALFMLGLAVCVAVLTGRRSLLLGAAAGLSLGLASLVKATPMGYPVVLALLFGIYLLRRDRRAGATVAVLYLAFAVPVVGWAYRNWEVSGHFSPTSTDSAVNFWWGTHPRIADFRREGTGFAMKLPEYFTLLQGERYDAPDAAARFMAAGRRNLAADPVGVVGRGLVNAMYVWLTPMTMRFVPSVPLNAVLTVVRLGLWLLVLIGAIAAWREGQGFAVAAIALVFVYVTLTLTVFLAMHRLVTPFMPAFFPLAAMGAVRMGERWRQRTRAARLS